MKGSDTGSNRGTNTWSNTWSMTRCCLGLFICAVTALSLPGCGPDRPIRIGLVIGLSGGNADFGESGRNGALLAVESHNAKPGSGRKFELIVRDDEGNPERSAALMSELSKDGVDAVIGGFVSASAQAMLPVANDRHVVLMSPTASSTELANHDDYLFRLFGTTRDNTTAYAERHFKVHGAKRVAMIADKHNAKYTQSWVRDYRAAFERLGGAITLEDAFDSTERVDYPAILKKMAESKPDLLLFVASSIDVARFAQGAHNLNLPQKVAGADWAAIDSLIELGGKTVEGMEFFMPLDRTDKSPRYQEFLQAYRSRFHSELNFVSQASYEAASVLMTTLESKKADRDLKLALLEKARYPGLQVEIAFNGYGDATRRGVWMKVENGEFHRIP